MNSSFLTVVPIGSSCSRNNTCSNSLCIVAGHRALERILPKQYVLVWERLTELAEARSAVRSEASARARAAKERERKSKQRELREVLNKTGVTMASDKLEMVQALLEAAKWGGLGRGLAALEDCGGEGRGLSERVAQKLQADFGVCEAHVTLAAANMRAGADPDAFCSRMALRHWRPLACEHARCRYFSAT
jgi:hypothetical protein